MKRLLAAGSALALCAMLALPAVSSAQSTFDRNVGCGLGNIILKEKDSIVFQVLAVTTNGTFGNQTFGISSGTLGCQQPPRVVKNERLEKFVASNMDGIAMDMAAGKGESLEALAVLLEVPVEKRGEFYSALQKNFKKIYAEKNVESGAVIDSVASLRN